MTLFLGRAPSLGNRAVHVSKIRQPHFPRSAEKMRPQSRLLRHVHRGPLRVRADPPGFLSPEPTVLLPDGTIGGEGRGPEFVERGMPHSRGAP